MSGKQFTRVTCAASLLLAELAPPAAAQSLEPPDDISTDAVPVGSDQHPKALATTANDVLRRSLHQSGCR